MEYEIERRLPAKMRKIITAGKIIGTVIVAAITVYTLIPKSEKIKNINTDVLVDNYSAR